MANKGNSCTTMVRCPRWQSLHLLVCLLFLLCHSHRVHSLTLFSMLLETGIFVSQAIWLWRVRHVRAEAKKAGKTYDEYIAENPSKKLFASESSETFVDVEAGIEKRSGSTCTEKTAVSQHENILATPSEGKSREGTPNDATATSPETPPKSSSESSPEAPQQPPAAVLKPSGSGPS